MEAVICSEVVIPTYQITRRHDRKYHNINLSRRESPKLHPTMLYRFRVSSLSINKIRNACIIQKCGAFAEALLQMKRNSRSLYIVEPDIKVKNTKILSVAQTLFLCQIYVAANNKTTLGLHVKCPIFLSTFKQIWSFSTPLH